MADGHPLVDIALEVARVSDALAAALEAHDLDDAERLLIERGRLLEAARDLSAPVVPADVTRLLDIRTAILASDHRCTAALTASIDGVHTELGDLATGARAMRAYLTPAPLAPGYVDRHD